jgi:ERF superfamily
MSEQHHPFPGDEDIAPEAPPSASGSPANGHKPMRSPTIGKLVEALCKAQLEFAPVVKANINPQFKSKYADLATIIQATMPALAKHGLVIIQTPYVKDRYLTMTTLLVHSSDEWIANELTMPATMRNELTAQTIGSACTYSRRYALQSILGVSADLDDDATEASGGGSREAAQAVATEKIADLRKKTGKTAPAGDLSEYVKSLFFLWDDEKQEAIIEGAQDLKEANRELLLSLCKWDAKRKVLWTDADGLDGLKYQLEQRGVSFLPLKSKNANA